ncbi:uncharacterized protein LOC116004069 [Ipomoea triloba]|uniref:uncharacterized protein LOC116004069 n=1 Tax=Ipomoea triloba TaxID=35885 RepID=UPI00125DFC69|nr:uncharacterized protein LOC116004069 [Ipomoea triloba]
MVLEDSFVPASSFAIGVSQWQFRNRLGASQTAFRKLQLRKRRFHLPASGADRGLNMVPEPRNRSFAAVVSAVGNSSATAPTLGQQHQAPVTSSLQQPTSVEDYRNPLFIHINENMNAVLVSPPLTGANYSSWSRSMEMALQLRNKWGLINGKIPAPEVDDPEFETWNRCDIMVRSWLLKSISPSIAQSVMYIGRARGIWNDLKNRKEKDEDNVIRFLKGLNEEFASIKSGVLILDPMPPVDKVFGMAIKLERQLQQGAGNINIGKEPIHANATLIEAVTDGVIAAVIRLKDATKNMDIHKVGYQVISQRISRLRIKEIQSLHQPLPINLLLISTGQDIGIGISSEQFQKLVSMIQNKVAHTIPNTSTAATVTTTASGLTPNFKATGGQPSEGKYTFVATVNTLMKQSNVWILDTGETDHIVCSLSYFDEYVSVQGTMVNMPNGDHAPVTHMGNIKLSEGFWLQNVLYIPAFSFNIVSASKLTKQTACSLIVMADKCLIQEGPGTKMIGFAREEKGLYHLISPPPKKESFSSFFDKMQCSAVSLEVWHNRLGHFPINKMHFYMMFNVLFLLRS